MKNTLRNLLLGLTSLTCMSLPTHAAGPAGITSQPFGHTKDGTPVEIYTLRNSHGCEARITNYGGIVVSLTVPDKDGKPGDVLLGFDTVGEYEKDSPYFGALIGRYGNRIAKGKFTLDGKEYTLATNDPPNALHGGKKGFDKRVWQARAGGMGTDGFPLTLTYVSKDGEEGYPGTLTVKAVYTLTEENALRIAFEATTDAPTVVNLTNHAYFDLRGQAATGDILDHVVTLKASKYLPVDQTSIPLGELRPVAGTPFDFTKGMSIGSRINDPDDQLHIGPGGYDHCYALDGYGQTEKTAEPFLAAHILEPKSGRVLELWTREPGVQFYSGNFLEGKFAGKGGKVYEKHAAFCLEPQHYPDSPNRPEYPSVTLKPGETYRNTFEYRFSVQK